MNKEYNIFEAAEAKEEYVEAIQSLLPQLSSSQHAFTIANLQQLVECENTHLLLLQAKGRIAGMLTLCRTFSPTGTKIWIEDVVVEASQRGCSFGRALVEHAIEYVRNHYKEATLMLTSRPSRVAANALYRSTGFSPRETNVYSMKFSD
ncbi:MAG: GNAT family N-acetyltransferase [Bacteroidaceae bacterium]|nr:GNAT family N-acetyltransferase [Bacteroidaceae bacterium]